MCIDGCIYYSHPPSFPLYLFQGGKKRSSKATERYFSANRVENSSSFGQAETTSWVSLGLSGRLLFTELTLSGHAGARGTNISHGLGVCSGFSTLPYRKGSWDSECFPKASFVPACAGHSFMSSPHNTAAGWSYYWWEMETRRGQVIFLKPLSTEPRTEVQASFALTVQGCGYLGPILLDFSKCKAFAFQRFALYTVA